MNPNENEMKPTQIFRHVPARNAGVCGNAHACSPTHQEIEHRAFEIYVANGRGDGRSDENWLQAERQLAAFDDAPFAAAGATKFNPCE